MTPRRWLALLAFYITYLLFGASIYYHIESQLEIEKRHQDLQERRRINDLLIKNLRPNESQKKILDEVSEYCEKKVTNHTDDEYPEPLRWSFYHSFIFAFTVCSTVGYGNLAPSTTLGRMIMIVYSLIGIPINGILFAGLGDFFGRTFTGIYRRYKEYKMSRDNLYVPRQFGLFATVAIALIPGITCFIILPSVLFTYFEGWPYTLSIYFSYVTTTTIGFGDYVPTFQPHQEQEFGIAFAFYKIFIVIWFIFALGYLVMIMTFITKGLRSKRLRNLEHQLSVNIKATQSRIWQGVTKDVGYLRRILNELYIMKFKPVYHEPGGKFTTILLQRSASCPDLSMYRVITPIPARKRAFSENLDSDRAKQELYGITTPKHPSIVRGLSDTNLDKINKQKTFETARAFMETTDLLAKVVTALGNLRMAEEEQKSVPSTVTGNDRILSGYHGLSDSQILASERSWSGWSLSSPEQTAVPYIKRQRACSDFQIPSDVIPSDTPNEWTWGGDNDQIQEVINKRVKTTRKQKDLYRASFQTPKFEKSIIFNPSDIEAQKEPSESKSIFKRIKPFKKRPSEDIIKIPTQQSVSTDSDTQTYLDRTDRGRDSKQSTNRYTTATNNAATRRGSLFSVPSQEEIDHEILETTTIADLIRALEVMHTQANLPDSNEINEDSKPKRKMGTASLTPPPLFTLFPQQTQSPSIEQQQQQQQQQSQTIHPPSTYSRRATIFSTFPNYSPQQTITSTNRRVSIRPPNDPPPYSETEAPRFKRRFSVRPTNLQTPPGMAPPPTTPSQQVQTVLQRRLSLRPSPLARDNTTSTPSTIDTTNRVAFNRQIPAQRSSRGSISSSSAISSRTHSPLTRIAQLQASRRGSTPEFDNTKRHRTRYDSK